MSKVQLDAELRAKLKGLSQQVEVCDESGLTVGVFLPLAAYEKLLYASGEIPFTKEEIARFRSEKGGCSLAEFWKKMGVQ